jgi:hypothetical protein
LRPQEAIWIGNLLRNLDVELIGRTLELGTSSRSFREISKPHIARNIHKPLIDRGVSITTSDLFDADGVDIVGDIYDPGVQKRLTDVQATTLLVCNIFEHVRDPGEFAKICDKLLLPGGMLIVTVPYSYPYHLDPIDTLFRPKPEEVLRLFPGYQIVSSDIISSDTHADDLRTAKQNVPMTAMKDLLKSLVFRGGVDRSLARMHRLLWLFKRYQITCVAMVKPT